MKLFLICSKNFYDRIPDIKQSLESQGHEIRLPNCFDNPETEARFRNLGTEEHSKWKSGIYIGGATFLEMYDAFKLNKKIFIYNNIPEGMLKDEIIGFCPILIEADLNKIV